ncbi:hypothetical protein DMC30DRAFT_46179 [Rhodotorula diobovata]|uniref:Uncharacterized protein n=1 Tax=Rhodotorula diobovata TaxID=5288 RepID=A0A5C5G2F1_9BASI|nr:hypothetical protein DMC30DRAFT_46179 [Rhodotorula diobovata]
MSHAHHGAHHAQDQGHQTALSLLQQWAHVVANLKLARADTEQNEQHRRQELFHACKQVAKFALQADEDWMLAQNLLEEDAFKAHRAAVNRRKEVEGHLAADEVRLRDLGRERDRLKRAWKRVKEGTSTAERQKERHELEGRLLVVRQELGNVMADVQLASDRWHGYRALAGVIRQAERGEVVYPPPPLYTAPRSPARQPGGRGRRPPSTIYMEPLVFEDGRPPSSHSHSNEHRRGSVSPLGAPSADWDAPPSGVGHSGRRASHHSTVYTPGAQRTPSDSGRPGRVSFVPSEISSVRSSLCLPTRSARRADDAPCLS